MRSSIGLGLCWLAACGSPEKADCLSGTELVLYEDVDGDGAGDASTETTACELTDGFVTNGEDCDDTDPQISPFEPEICDGIDQDCDAVADDDLFGGTWYADNDGDGYGNLDEPVQACRQPENTSDDTTDCDDEHGDAHPGAPEVCDGYDNNCDTLVDDLDPTVDVTTGTNFYPDADSDGFGDENRALMACINPDPGVLVAVGEDCNDGQVGVNPNSLEVCDELDNNCDDLVDEEDPTLDPTELETFYEDLDDDGVGNDAVPFLACDLPDAGYASGAGDCDDNSALITGPSLWVPDLDGDGWGLGAPVSAVPSCTAPQANTAPQPPTEDCDDADPGRFPSNPEVCDDGIDQDCSGVDAHCTQPTCEDYYLMDPTLPSGVYRVEPVAGVISDVWCDMDVDGGGWTLVMSSGNNGLPTDGAGSYHADLTTMLPGAPHLNPWDGMKPAIGAAHDVRFACRTGPMSPLAVDLSFYDVDWYDLMTNGNEVASCWFPVGLPLSPSRRNNVSGLLLPLGDAYNSGSLEGEDGCGSPDDFTIDFDDRGMDSNQADGTDWGSDDSSSKCGVTTGHSFFILVR